MTLILRSTLCLATTIGTLLGAAGLRSSGAAEVQNIDAAAISTVQAVDIGQLRDRLGQHCFDCHGDGADEGGLNFESLVEGLYGDQTQRRWEAVWKNIRAETMPPVDEQQPALSDRQAWIRWIQQDVFRLDPTRIDPGKVVLRRLNRAEYAETIRQLTDVNFDARENFPADDTGYGFDTIGEVLHISPVLLEKYLTAADEIVAEAVPLDGPKPPRTTYWSDHFHFGSPDGPPHEGVLFKEPRSFHVKKKFDRPGKYRVSLHWDLEGAWTGTDQEADVELQLHPSDGGKDSIVRLDSAKAGFAFEVAGALTAEVTVTDNPLHLSVRFNPTSTDNRSKQADNAQPAPYTFRIDHVDFDGPIDGDVLEYRKGEQILIGGPPPADADKSLLDSMTREVLAAFATNAFRRPIDSPTLDRLVQIAADTRGQYDKGYEHGIAAALKLILASPRFLFRVEQPLAPEKWDSIPPNFPTSTLGQPIDDFSLASRISYFLWGGPPDEELMQVAGEGKLRDTLDSQITRMIEDEWRMRTGVSNFVGQWLKTRDVHNMSFDVRRILAYRQDDDVFRWQVREAMKQETEMLFRHLIEQDRPIEELLNADYTFLNEELAKFYGISGIEGREMRKVSLPADSHRKGILTHGSVLLVTSNPTRTSPVKRGLFILENLLGTPSPPAPPNVPALEDSKSGELANASLREILEYHRRDPACASCHNRMDPLGLALENYNAIGQYRDRELGLPAYRNREAEPDKPIDPTGVLMTGETFASVTELADILATQRRGDFYRCLTEKMLVYALGRGLTYSDATTVDQIVAELKANDGRMQALIKAVIRSVPFTHQPKSESIATLSAR